MSRAIVIMLLLSGTLLLSSCATSFHQMQREADRLGIPPELAQQIDTSVTFADNVDSPDLWANQLGK